MLAWQLIIGQSNLFFGGLDLEVSVFCKSYRTVPGFKLRIS